MDNVVSSLPLFDSKVVQKAENVIVYKKLNYLSQNIEKSSTFNYNIDPKVIYINKAKAGKSIVENRNSRIFVGSRSAAVRLGRFIAGSFNVPSDIEKHANEGSLHLINKFKRSTFLENSHLTVDEENNIVALLLGEDKSITVVFLKNQWIHVSISKHIGDKALLSAKAHLTEQKNPSLYLDKLVSFF